MIKYESNCPLCKRPRVYKSKQSYIRGLERPCRSCANSIQQGGVGGCDEICPSCGGDKEDPYKRVCDDCKFEKMSSYHSEIYRYSRYGVTKAWFEKEAKAGCGICGKRIFTHKNGCIDHDHTTGLIRGVLCTSCNKGLGQFKDSIEALQEASRYVKKHNRKKAK